MWLDDLDTAFRHLDLYDRFGCPGGHVQATFRCLTRFGAEIDPKVAGDAERPHSCLLDQSGGATAGGRGARRRAATAGSAAPAPAAPPAAAPPRRRRPPNNPDRRRNDPNFRGLDYSRPQNATAS